MFCLWRISINYSALTVLQSESVHPLKKKSLSCKGLLEIFLSIESASLSQDQVTSLSILRQPVIGHRVITFFTLTSWVMWSLETLCRNFSSDLYKVSWECHWPREEEMLHDNAAVWFAVRWNWTCVIKIKKHRFSPCTLYALWSYLNRWFLWRYDMCGKLWVNTGHASVFRDGWTTVSTWSWLSENLCNIQSSLYCLYNIALFTHARTRTHTHADIHTTSILLFLRQPPMPGSAVQV